MRARLAGVAMICMFTGPFARHKHSLEYCIILYLRAPLAKLTDNID